MSEQNLKQVLAKKQSILQGDAERIAKQRAAGKLTARERVAKLLDAGSFVETDALVSRNGDYAGVVTGSGTVQDRPVYVFAQDFTVHGGAMGQMQAQKIVKVLDLAQKTGAPVIALCDSAGVRIDEGAAAMNAYASVFTRLAKLSGVVPVIALVLGPVVGGAAMIAQLADITIEAENVGQLMVYGPQVMSAISGKTVDAKAVGGAKTMAAQGGVALTAKDADEAISLAVQVLDYLPGCNAEDAAIVDTDDMNRILPVLDAADAESQLAAMADGAAYVELFKDYGKEIRVALTRVGGRPVGLVVGNGKENDGLRGSDDGEGVHRHRQCHRSGVCRHGRQEQCRCDLRVAGRGDFRPDPRSGGAGALHRRPEGGQEAGAPVPCGIGSEVRCGCGGRRGGCRGWHGR